MASKITKIFFSYSKKDSNHPATVWIIDALKRNPNLSLWEDRHQIKSGDRLIDVIERSINEADYMIQFLSYNSPRSQWANIEYELAYASEIKNQTVKIITLILPEVEFASTRVLGRGQRGIVIQLGTNYKESLSEVLKALNLDGESLIKFEVDRIINNRTIIDISAEVNLKLIEYFSLHPQELKRIDRRLFEELIAELFNGFGFEIELTQKTRDGGRDIIAVKKAEVALKYLIECKRPDPENPVGIKPVRELFGVKQDEKASKAILVTTTYFSPDALQFFERNKWELEPKDFFGINEWVKDYLMKKNIV